MCLHSRTHRTLSIYLRRVSLNTCVVVPVVLALCGEGAVLQTRRLRSVVARFFFVLVNTTVIIIRCGAQSYDVLISVGDEDVKHFCDCLA